MKRRTFIKLSAAGFAGAMASACGSAPGLLGWGGRERPLSVGMTLYLTDGYVTQPDGVDVYFRGFSDAEGSLTVPATSLVVGEGDTVQLTVVNTLSTTHSFVIDGVVDSGPIAPGQTQLVEFVASQAGSYLFYDGQNAPYNRLLGLHGALAVMPLGSTTELYAGSPSFVQQYVWIFNDVDPVWHEELRLGNTPTTDFIPRYFTINGRTSRPPGHPEHGDPNIDSMANPDTKVRGSIGDRALIRIFNAGLCCHSLHWHGNHVEWLTRNGQQRPDVWKKDSIFLENNLGAMDVIYPFEPPPDAFPPVTTGMYPMHLHDEQTQTAGGGNYLFGAMTDIMFE